jgi:hypothetical protein
MTGNGDVVLSDIMADEPETAPEVKTPEAPASETPEAAEARRRDELGRFAPKETSEQPTTEAAPEARPEQGKVPLAAVSEARAKEREAKQENEQLKQMISQLQGQVNLLARQRQPEKPQAEPEKPADWWENPDTFVESKLTRVDTALQQQNERISLRFAIKEHGEETVQAAYDALGKAMQSDPTAKQEYSRIRASDDPYDEIVKWHKRQETLQRVGTDPEAWLEAEMEKRLNDPAYQAKVLERIQGTAAQNTNRSAPITKLPPSLARMPSAGGNASGEADMSDAGLFRTAMR